MFGDGHQSTVAHEDSDVFKKTMLAAVIGLTLLATHAQAGVRLNLGITIPLFAPRPPRPVYVAPPPVYVVPAPRPVYVAPAPVYVQPQPAPVYVQPAPVSVPQ
jgi:hypothetical protein